MRSKLVWVDNGFAKIFRSVTWVTIMLFFLRSCNSDIVIWERTSYMYSAQTKHIFIGHRTDPWWPASLRQWNAAYNTRTASINQSDWFLNDYPFCVRLLLCGVRHTLNYRVLPCQCSSLCMFCSHNTSNDQNFLSIHSSLESLIVFWSLFIVLGQKHHVQSQIKCIHK